MTTILIPENPEDMKVVRDMEEQAEKHGAGGKGNTSPEAVVLVPNPGEPGEKWAKWTVIDNRDHQCFTEDFATLDGALVYATDLRTTCEHQERWDRDGWFHKELLPYVLGKKLECDSAACDPLERWDSYQCDHDELVGLFVEAIDRNVNKNHVVRYLTEDHDNGDGTYETEFLVEITYSNQSGAMGAIDEALEEMNGRDWRVACDKFLERRLRKLGKDPDKYDWPAPDARVTFDYFEDENDIVKTVTVVWAVDEETWKACNPNARTREPGTSSGEVCNTCDGDLGTLPDNVVAVVCPHCGDVTGVCCNCPDHSQCERGGCPYVQKEKHK